MFGDLIPLPIDSSCPQFTSSKVGQEQGATTEKQAASRGLSIIMLPDSQKRVSHMLAHTHIHTDRRMDR